MPKRVRVSEEAMISHAMTVGLASANDLYSTYGSGFGVAHLMGRCSLIRAYVDFTDTSCLKHSPVFNLLDPTEKGSINYHLGMIFTKMMADRYLNTPYLVHYSWMEQNGYASILANTKSSPDLLGFDAVSGTWSTFEAKGRNSSFASDVMNKAKTQASLPVKIGGQNCSMAVAAALFRKSNSTLEFRWEDPAFHYREPILLTPSIRTWRNYFYHVHSVLEFESENPGYFKALTGFTIRPSFVLQELLELLFQSRVDDLKKIESLLEQIQKNTKSLVRFPQKGEYYGSDGLILGE